MTLNIIDIAACMMLSVNKAVLTMSGLQLRDMPSVNREPIPEFVVQGHRGTFISIVKFDQKGKKWARGAIALYISTEQIQTLFSKNYQIALDSPDADIIDVCGEFCNVIAGGFKKELVNLGYGEMQIEIPQNFYKDFSQKVDIVIHSKYELLFVFGGQDLLKIDVSIESPE